MKRQILWITALGLFWAFWCFAPALLGWNIMDGSSGLVIKFFLGYCAIILVAQLFSALAAVRSLLEELNRESKPSRRVMLR
jgi:hypothetical protein